MPRIEGETLSAHREQLRRRIFEAFAELMGESSFDAVTMRGLAERAGIGRTAIYHHFSDKEAVLVAFATHETQAYTTELQAALTESDDPAQQLRIYVRHHLAAGEKFHMGFGPALYGFLSPTARLEIRDHVVEVEGVLRGILQRGRECGEFSFDDLDATLSLVHACLSPRHLPVAAIEDFVLRAVGAEGSGD
ncbi:TetR/AcrR family transcriptional regulator [Nocardioides sp. zg-536]|uniref:TetR/AcrR family transcriptional regulator n=1 Tax=Nocardioides faecalis TaxID=2803858 RepID=A0A938Y3M6_9ACTN|nr:TetR/AcrR family transcriptional regulator [Nocardioides faecalis]MBM9459393.1 TetR/AcrR family transcriptional regulator [Nocardioides faecalis]MBS4751634.1 TetR/AcrR family transcriptional regulator [Nocardioides faecalis]QVI59498.1 TetR/AcrR family transcriptional regulator [Nocardioides faecalis]